MIRVLLVLLCCPIAAAPLAGCAKSSSSSASASAAPGGAAAAPGANVYAGACASCHQTDGEGSPGAFPPLARNPVVTGDPVKVIHIVKYGLTGPLQVNGKPYAGTMPAWSSQISDAEIAAAITYVRSSWGNRAGPVTAAQVTAVTK